MSGEVLLEALHLKKHFPLRGAKHGVVRAVEDVSFSIRRGETFGLVGESGSGKTTLCRTLLRLYKPDGGRIFYRGETIYDGDNPRAAADMRPLRRKLQLTFQDPQSSLSPRMTARQIAAEAIDIHRLAESPAEWKRRVAELFDSVGLEAALMDRYPHELSGGQQQRLGIARALAAEPEFIALDEPVSALDTTVQAKILRMLEKIQRDRGLTYLFIAHDLSVVRHISSRVGVMYRGGLVETAPSDELFANPVHPYTQALLSSAPLLRPLPRREGKLPPEKSAARPFAAPGGCGFYSRCPCAVQRCALETPRWKEHTRGHFAACHLAD